MTEITSEEKIYWTACAGIGNIGWKTFERILAFKQRQSLSWSETWTALISNRTELHLTGSQLEQTTLFHQKYTPASYFDWLREQEIGVLTSRDKEYPFLLQQIDDKPFILFTQGEWNWGRIPVAIVGTRRATGYGRKVTEKIAEELALNGATIVSGFMYGVDTIAHTQALANGGKTIGVLGYGFHHRFPKSHTRLYEEFLTRGMTFVTEYPPPIPAFPGNFPIRNRIVAGMSLATIVTEGALESGSLITAKLALDYNRVVGAVPGAIDNPFSEGTKWLINQGARFVSSGADVLEELKYQVSTVSTPAVVPEFDDPLQHTIYTYLLAHPVTPEDLSHVLKVPFPVLTTTLSLMELDGYIVREGERWRVC